MRIVTRTHALGLFLAAALVCGTGVAAAQAPADEGLAVFRAWLDRTHPGYGADELPARFQNRTVDAAYPGVRLYYVLTYTRGIRPPFPNAISLVAAVDELGEVTPYRPGAPESYRRGLLRVKSSKDARLAAAGVLILASCDPGERRWKLAPDRFRVKKDRKGWLCTYTYEPIYASWVRFDRKGVFQEFGGSAPPVP